MSSRSLIQPVLQRLQNARATRSDGAMGIVLRTSPRSMPVLSSNGTSGLSHCGKTCSRVSGEPPQKTQVRGVGFFPMDKDRADEPKQTTPKGHAIPVPKKSDWERNLERVTKPPAKQEPKR